MDGTALSYQVSECLSMRAQQYIPVPYSLILPLCEMYFWKDLLKAIYEKPHRQLADQNAVRIALKNAVRIAHRIAAIFV